MTSSDTPAGMLPVPDIGPLAAPHAVPADGASWPAGLARRWRAALARNAYTRPARAADPEPGGRRFFQHLM